MGRFQGSVTLGVAFAGIVFAGPALAADCPDNPDAIGTSRTITVDTAALARVGVQQYKETIPLEPKEVILTFDDGPAPPMTLRVLEILQSECVKATFFLIGRNARAFSAIVRQIANDGHTVANHTQNHPFATMSPGRGIQEIESGYRSIAAALEASGRKPAPFFRFPGLKTTPALESYLRGRGISAMSTDFLADDWYRRITPEGVLIKAISRLEARGGSGMMLLHDVKPGTALILPELLKELKERGYSIVHMVPAEGAAAKIAQAPTAAVAETPKVKSAKRRVLAAREYRRARINKRETASLAEAKPTGRYWPRTVEKDWRENP